MSAVNKHKAKHCSYKFLFSSEARAPPHILQTRKGLEMKGLEKTKLIERKGGRDEVSKKIIGGCGMAKIHGHKTKSDADSYQSSSLLEQQRLLTTKEVANMLNVDESTIYKWADMGKIRYVDLGTGKKRLLRFRKEDIQQLIEENIVDNRELLR